jgi:hypothetical protein
LWPHEQLAPAYHQLPVKRNATPRNVQTTDGCSALLALLGGRSQSWIASLLSDRVASVLSLAERTMEEPKPGILLDTIPVAASNTIVSLADRQPKTAGDAQPAERNA